MEQQWVGGQFLSVSVACGVPMRVQVRYRGCPGDVRACEGISAGNRAAAAGDPGGVGPGRHQHACAEGRSVGGTRIRRAEPVRRSAGCTVVRICIASDRLAVEPVSVRFQLRLRLPAVRLRFRLWVLQRVLGFGSTLALVRPHRYKTIPVIVASKTRRLSTMACAAETNLRGRNESSLANR